MHANSPIGHVDLNGGFVRRSATILCACIVDAFLRWDVACCVQGVHEHYMSIAALLCNWYIDLRRCTDAVYQCYDLSLILYF